MMGQVEDHYRDFLATNYSWMSGGANFQIQEYTTFFQSIGLSPKRDGKALDLGCGSGFQTIALADLHYHVAAVDSSNTLIEELRATASNKNVTSIVGDMRDSHSYSALGPYELIICMGDSIVHLPSVDEVKECIHQASAYLEDQGQFILSFRDLTKELHGSDRAIPVRLDDERLMATFLEYEPSHVVVNDMIFLKESDHWAMRKSSYRKLRLAPETAIDILQNAGLIFEPLRIHRGFVTIVARKKAATRRSKSSSF